MQSVFSYPQTWITHCPQCVVYKYITRSKETSKCEKAKASSKLKHEHTCHKLTAKFLTETHITRSIAVRNKRKRHKWNEKRLKEKLLHFSDHWDVQLIPFTLSSLEFDSPLEECFSISGSLLACLGGSS